MICTQNTQRTLTMQQYKDKCPTFKKAAKDLIDIASKKTYKSPKKT